MTMTIEQFKELTNDGNYLWQNDINGRQSIEFNTNDNIEILWGAVPVDGTGGIVSSISTHTTNNFQYTSGIYGGPVPGTGDSSMTLHRFTMIFPDAQKSAKDIVPIIVQFQRCPIIPVLSAELIKEGVTAVAQMQCNISTLDDAPGGIKLDILVGEVDVPLHTCIATPKEGDNKITDEVNFSLWHITNYPLLRWFVYDFHNGSDPRFNAIKTNGAESIRNMMEAIEDKIKASGENIDATFHLSHLNEEYLNMFSTFNEVIMEIIGFMSNPAAYVSSGSEDPMQDLIDYIRNELASDSYGSGQAAIDQMLNEVEDLIRNAFSLMVQSENKRLSRDEYKYFQEEVVRVLSQIMELRSGFITDADSLSGFFSPVGGSSVCQSVTLQLVNQFKPIPLSNTSTQIWQYLGPGRGGLTIDLTTDEENDNSLGKIRNMFRTIASSVSSTSHSASMPASMAFSRVITWPTILANKMYFIPDTMATSTVPGYPTLRTVSLQFSLFDGDIVNRAKVHKMFENNTLDNIQISDEALSTGAQGYSARDVRGQAASGIGSFYDLYLPWFIADDTIKNINSFPIELPTWEEIAGASDATGSFNHLSYDDIVSIYRGQSVQTDDSGIIYNPNGDDNTRYIPITIDNSGTSLSTNIMQAYAPPDFWCHHNAGNYLDRFITSFNDTTITNYGASESEDDAERIKQDMGKPKMAWSKTSPYWSDFELKDYVEDELYYSGKLSLTRCFPSAYFLFSSHTTMGFGIFLQDMGWGYGMLEDMSIIQRGDIPVDTAVIRLVNLFGKLDDPLFGGGGLINLFLATSYSDAVRMTDAINNGMDDRLIQDIRDWGAQTSANFADIWRNTWQWTGMWPTHSEEMEAQIRNARSHTDVLPLAPGMWAHVRMGYGQPYQHATVFNGRIASYKPGDIVEIECESFGADLTKTMPADSSDKHNCEPRKDMCRVLNKPLSGIKAFIWNITQPGTGLASGLVGGMIAGQSSMPTMQVGAVATAIILPIVANHMISKGIPLWYPTEGLGESIFTTQLAIQATGSEGGSQSRSQGTGSGHNTQVGASYHLTSSGDKMMPLTAIIMGTPGDPTAVGAQAEMAINIYNASPLADPGVNQFGIGWADNSEDPTAGNSAGKRRSQEILSNKLDIAAIGELADEVTFGYSYYGRTFIDFATTCARLTGDYIFTVVPIANRCTIFYGKPDWPIWYKLLPMGPQEGTEGNTTGGDVIAVRRPFDQYSIHGVGDIIYNDITAQKDFATGVKPSWSRGRPGNMADQTMGIFWEAERDLVNGFWAEDGTFSQIPIQWFDADIHPAEKRVIQEDTQILKIVGGVAPEGTKAAVVVVGIIVGIIAAAFAISSGGVSLGLAAGLAILVTVGIKVIADFIGWLGRMIDLLVEYLLGVDIEDIFAWGDRANVMNTINTFNTYDIPAGFLANMKGIYWAQVSGVAKGILKEEVETMYRGSLYIVGNPVPRPHRTQVLMDPKTGMTGGFAADTVVHHLSIESGYVTEIIPKVKTTVWDTNGLAKWTFEISTLTRVASGLAIGYFMGRYIGMATLYSLSVILSGLKGVPGKVEGMIDVLKAGRWKDILEAGAGSRKTIGGFLGNLGRTSEGVKKAFQAGKSVTLGKFVKIASIIGIIITEAAFSMFMAAWSETIRAARACYIAPLSKYSRPFVAGIGGWRGSVIMNGEAVNKSSDDLSFEGQGAYGFFLKMFVGI